MKILKNYQSEKVEQLVILSKMYFNSEDKETIVFQSPTGSGKTLMMTNYISKIVDETDLRLCFLWVSIGEGELHKQSLRSVKREINPKITCSLLEKEFFGYRDSISENEIVFLNWEKIRKKDKETGEYTNSLMKDKDTINFIEVLENTRNKGINIILIIDESHKGATTERAMELRDNIIKPFMTIEMSATPVLTNDMATRVSVDPSKVIEEGMIKKEVIINSDIEKISNDEITSEQLILESAYRKQKELKSYYKKLNVMINPLVLIQLPNSSQGEEKKNIVLDFLKNKKINETKIARWLSDEKINNDYELLNDLNSEIEYLIFKQAIDTGWDCPRAQILVKFRETNSITFEIQTVGRILRMPEAKHYSIEELNKAYVYTNIKSIQIKKELYNPNIIKTLYSKRNDNYKPIKLKSFYRNRVDFGNVTANYKMFFEKEFCNYFNIPLADQELTNPLENIEKMKNKGIIIEKVKLDSIITNYEVSSTLIDKGIKADGDNHILLSMSDHELEYNFKTIIIKNLNGFAPVRSISHVTTGIIFAFRKYLGIGLADGGISFIENIVVNNKDTFSVIISNSINDYKDFHRAEVEKKTQGRYNSEWEIPLSKNYNPYSCKKIESILSIMQPLYLPVGKNDEPDQLEVSFINYLEKNSKFINWFWKNGDEHMESNFGIQKENGYTFQPDFIVSFKNGCIGIFDTKAGKGFNETDNEEKSNALYKYIAEERFNKKNLVGGLVIYDEKESKFKFYQKPLYKSYNEDRFSWESVDELLK